MHDPAPMRPAILLTLPPPAPCRIIRRETRFTVTVDLYGHEELTLLRNTGRLHEILYPGALALCVPRSGHGKTRHLLVGGALEGREAALIDPKTQCDAFEAAESLGLIPWLKGWRIDRREIAIGGSRLDYGLDGGGGARGFLEAKSAVHFTGHYTMYPDCPSERGRRHIRLLRGLKKEGYRSVLMFVAAHPAARAFAPDVEADPELVSELLRASAEGVEVYAVKMSLRADGAVLLLDPALDVDLQSVV